MFLQLTPPKGDDSLVKALRGQSWSQGPVQVGVAVSIIGRVKQWHDRSTPGAAAVPILVSESGDTVQTKRAVHRFSAIKMRSLNDPRQARLHPCNR
jgi:hypothetical protein